MRCPLQTNRMWQVTDACWQTKMAFLDLKFTIFLQIDKPPMSKLKRCVKRKRLEPKTTIRWIVFVCSCSHYKLLDSVLRNHLHYSLLYRVHFNAQLLCVDLQNRSPLGMAETSYLIFVFACIHTHTYPFLQANSKVLIKNLVCVGLFFFSVCSH